MGEANRRQDGVAQLGNMLDIPWGTRRNLRLRLANPPGQ